ncbi:MAG: competence/damage-inducible protein A [Geminicoccaceae bacterium]|nr:competence/damage-inducible protein A [Geminicoccaceae bacterium]MCB9943076.1 competence/damage-inducible protein A [Geminicoccaceae bacterium]
MGFEARRTLSETETVTACLIIIGNEILSGRTVDANLPHIAKRLNEKGIRLTEARIVPDIEAEIVDAVNICRARHNYVLTTGGIGPTHDDITSACMAKAFGVPFGRNEEAARRLEAFYGDRVNPARMRMADMPEGVALIDNPVSTAPGFIIGNVIVMAGVPKIMQAMLENVLPIMQGGEPMLSRTIVAYRPESEMAPAMAGIERDFPGIEVGSYPFFRMERYGTSVVLRGTDGDRLARAAAHLLDYLRVENIDHEDAG